ncbi:MAG: divergent PAP2 family protein [Huintestinicola sp.]|uniref:divergent PAP2 family protein n=1 Tax=Huintestinicola sp. TaxID=2981661 RepID=UPI003F0DF756
MEYYNYILVTSVLGWCIAQLLKTMINLIKYKKFSVERLFGAGGWPSAHSAMVCSAAAGVYRVEGVASTQFAIMCIVALITMYDAMGVRRAAGQHAKAINRINRILESKPASSGKPLEDIAQAANTSIAVMKEYLGHTPFEVASGAILGVILAFVMPIKI